MNGRKCSPTDDFPGEQIENHGHIEPAFPLPNVDDIGHPDLIWLRDIEVPLNQISDELSWFASNVSTCSAARLRSHPIFPH